MRIPFVAVFIISLIYSGCSDFRDSRLGTEGEPCFGNGTCKNGLQCVSGICKDENTGLTDEDAEKPDSDSGNTGNTSDDHDSGNSGNSGNSGDSGNTGDTGNTGNSGDTGNSGNTGNTGNTGDIDIDDADSDDSVNTPDDEPVDNCKDLNNPCNDAGDAYAICVNKTGGYDCNCSLDYHWDGSNCISNSRVFTCADKPLNTDWNSVSSYNQTWTGSSWNPPDSATLYSIAASTTSCRYICSTGNAWNGSECVTSTCSGNFPNTFGGLCWSNPRKSPTTWADAGTHCSSISGRRPTISELRKLIQNCPSTQTGGSCGVTDTCLSASPCFSSSCEQCTDATDGRYSVFGDMESLWSSQENSSYTANAWFVNFKNGRIYNGDKNYTPANYDVRCVK